MRAARTVRMLMIMLCGQFAVRTLRRTRYHDTFA